MNDNNLKIIYKKGELAIEGSERIRMCNLATQDLDWMKPCQVTYGSALEGARKLFPNKECIVVCFLFYL